MNCPDCGQPVKRKSPGCVLHALVRVARERGNVQEQTLRERHADCDVDALWEKLGPIVDQVEAGDI